MKKTIKIGFPALMATVMFFVSFTTVQASEVDFSCMKVRVWGKGHVSDQYKNYDVVIQNQCQGAAYWAMCIERMNPRTNQVVETHNPTGYIEAEKKARVNLHLKRSQEEGRFHSRYQEFYVNVGYDIEGAASASCNANKCEAQKRDVRAEFRANESAWEKAEKRLTALVAEKCPDTGWEAATKEECEVTLRAAEESSMEQYIEADQLLKEKLAAVDPENCQVWSGELIID